MIKRYFEFVATLVIFPLFYPILWPAPHIHLNICITPTSNLFYCAFLNFTAHRSARTSLLICWSYYNLVLHFLWSLDCQVDSTVTQNPGTLFGAIPVLRNAVGEEGCQISLKRHYEDVRQRAEVVGGCRISRKKALRNTWMASFQTAHSWGPFKCYVLVA